MITVPIIIQEKNNLIRTNEPVTLGLPFPQGMIKNDRDLTLLNERKKKISLQTQPLALWPDRSIKWLLLDFQASVSSRSLLNYQLIRESKSSEHTEGITLKKDNDTWVVNTGSASFHIDTNVFLPFKRVLKKNIEVIDGSSASCLLNDSNGRICVPEINKIILETSGSLRATIKADGFYRTRNNKKTVQFIARLHFYYGKSFVKVEFMIRNPKAAYHPGGRWDLGDKGSFFFKDLTLRVSLRQKNNMRIKYSIEGDNKFTETNGDYITIYQDSSGGENWKSTNHKNRFGKVMQKFKGFKVLKGEKVLEEGLRATPLIILSNDQTRISGAIKKFWQNFPKAMSINNKSMELSLFPKYYSDLYELQGGEQKTHTCYLDFGGNEAELNWVHSPLIPRSTPEWYVETKAIPYLLCNNIDKDIDLLINAAVKGEKSFYRKREIVDEYGWRNFGEIYADHEAVGHKGPYPLVSHYNNQYDPIYGFIRQYLIKPALSWYKLMNDLAHHVTDIDIYHTKDDREEYNGSMFWHTDHYLDAGTSTHRTFSKENIKIKGNNYGGGPGLEHCYTTGLLYHYYLTGEHASREAVLKVTDWVMRVLDGPYTILGFLYNFKKKLPIIKSILKGKKISYVKYPFNRNTGNMINTLLDAFLLTGEYVYIKTVEEVIKGCVNPGDVIENRNLLDAEISWSYTVCLQAIGRYLDIKVEVGETDNVYCYTRQSLIHYARWMLENEYPYLDKPEILEFPNESWPATDIRKSTVFYYAYKYTTIHERDKFLEKALFFYNVSVKEVNSFSTKILTRPIVILLQNHGMHSYFKENPDEKGSSVSCKYEFELPREFVSIKSLFTEQITKFRKIIKKTSFAKELKWMKVRMK